MTRLFILIAIAILLTVTFGFLGGFLGGACHCETPMTLFFPYGTIIGMRTRWESLGFVLTMLQFPLYAIVLASFKAGRRQVVVLLVLFLVHAATSLLGLTVYR